MVLEVNLSASQNADRAVRIAAFLSAFRSHSESRLEVRLNRYLAKYRRLSDPAPVATPQLEATRFAATLTLLASHLERSPNRDGANIWATAGLGHDEVRTSRVLAWWLDPRAGHGLAERFAEALWDAAGAATFGFGLSGLRRATREICPLADAADRVDIALDGDDFLVLVEVKIWAGLQPDQLQRYVRAAERAAALRGVTNHATLYLAPRTTLLPEQCRWVGWDAAAAALESVAPLARNAFDAEAARQFAAFIKTFG